MNQKEYSAAEAKRLLEELEPYFAKLEKQAVDDLASTSSWDEDADRKRLSSVERIKVLRDLKSILQSTILANATAVRVQRVV